MGRACWWFFLFFFFSSRRRHTRLQGDWSSDVCSSDLVAFDDQTADRLKEDVARQRQAGLRCDWLDGGEVRERWPGAAPECLGALFAPEDGAVDPQAVARACLADARRLGAAFQPEKIERLQIANGRTTGVISPRGVTAAAHVVIAAGVWSPQIGSRSEEHTSELQSPCNLVCRLLLEKKKDE